jgi:hypothetical protein
MPLIGHNLHIVCKLQETNFADFFSPLTGWGLHRFFENLSIISLKQDLSIDVTFYPPLFSLDNTFNEVFSLYNMKLATPESC